MIRCLSILFLALGFSNHAYAATPFGISMGQPLSELDVSEEGSKPWLNTVPNPHPSFSDYIVWGSAETGVCLVMAISKRYENDRYGISVQNDFSEFVAALEGKYGSSTEIDFGAFWGALERL